jgi:hypothetical protein
MAKSYSEELRLARQLWRHAQPLLNTTRLVFIDETGSNTAMTLLRGRCRKGMRLIANVPHGHWKTTTFVAGLRCDAIVAPLVVDGPMSGEIFRACVEQHSAPTLKLGDIVIMDNLPATRWKASGRSLRQWAPRQLICRPIR